MADSVDLDEVVHHEPPHQDSYCLQISHFWPGLGLPSQSCHTKNQPLPKHLPKKKNEKKCKVPLATTLQTRDPLK